MDTGKCNKHYFCPEVGFDFLYKYSSFSKNLIVLIFSNIRHLVLNVSQVKRIVNKLLNNDELRWPYKQISHVVYHVLNYCHFKEHRMFLFESVIKYFNDIKAKMSNAQFKMPGDSDLLDAESNSILHIINIAKPNRTILRDLIKIIKVCSFCFVEYSF